MSKRYKKFKMKKPLTEAERERRRILREQREERKIAERKASRRKFLSCLSIALVIIGCFILSVVIDNNYDTDFILYFIFVGAVILIILCDNSGFRSTLFSRLPDKFSFAEVLKRKNVGQCRTQETCKTVSYFAILLYIYANRFAPLLVIIWIICELTAFAYLIFDRDTSIRPAATPENGLSAAGDIIVITSLAMLMFTMDNIFTNSTLWTFTAIFTVVVTVLYLVCSNDRQDSIANIICIALAAGLFAFSGFCAVNRDLDFSEPKKHTAVIEDMNHTSGKNSHYTLYVKDWHGSEDTVSVEVSSDDYRVLNIGDTVTVYEYNGALGMNYYDYSTNP